MRPRITWRQLPRPLRASANSSRGTESPPPKLTRRLRHRSCQLAAISTTGSEARMRREDSQRREVSWGRQPVSTGMPQSPSRAWLMWAEISERPGPTLVPPFWSKVTITWRYSSRPWRRSWVTQHRRKVENGLQASANYSDTFEHGEMCPVVQRPTCPFGRAVSPGVNGPNRPANPGRCPAMQRPRREPSRPLARPGPVSTRCSAVADPRRHRNGSTRRPSRRPGAPWLRR
jgi:hypothetical protein